MTARVSGRGTTWPCARGQSGIASPDPVRRTIPPHTTSTKTSATVAMKKPGRRLVFAVLLLLPDGGKRVEVLGRRRRGDRPLQSSGLVRMVPGVFRGRLAAPEMEQHVQDEDRHPDQEDRRSKARDVIPDREFPTIRVDASRHPQ